MVPAGLMAAGVSVRVLEVAASDRVERSGVQDVDVHRSRSSRHGPSGDLVRDRPRLRAVPAYRGEQRLQGTRRPAQEAVAVGVTQSDGLVGHLGERVPLAGEEGVEAEESQRLDRHGHCAARAAVMHDSPQRRAAWWQAVDVGAGDRGSRDAGRARLVIQVGDRLFEAVEHGDGISCRIGDRLGQQLEEPGSVRLEPPHRSMEWWPQLGSPSEEAHFEQVVDRLDEHLVVRVGGIGRGFDGADEQAVRGVDIPISVEEVIAGCDRTGQ